MLLSGFGGCDETSPPDDKTEHGAIDANHKWELKGSCPLDSKIGEFKISHYETYSSLTGGLKDSVDPSQILFPRETFTDCVLLQKINPDCDPACGTGETCKHGKECTPGNCPGECIAEPRNQNLGNLTITGLTNALSLEPNSSNYYQELDIDSPPFTSESKISLYFPGKTGIDKFALDGLGVSPAVLIDKNWVIKRDKTTHEITDELKITWTPSNEGADILATLNVDQHGNSPATMFCTFKDTGSAVIPIEALKKFAEYGVTGYASGHLYRRTVDSEKISTGCVELQTFSHAKVNLSVTNHDPSIVPSS